MKDRYRATRGDKNALRRDLRPGDSIFIINEHAGDWGPSQTYREYIVTNKTSLISGYPIVEATSHGGKEPVDSLLARERDIYTQRPTTIPNVAVKDSHAAYTEDAHRTARLVGDLHAMEASAALASHYKRLARR
ncbi:hypothetical protein ACFVIY_17765 [Streptomyces sp. NPDC127166]|uniref:hypothetical protein n=1 Tax=Streptomyces sp. NPDC127166 TaxID=3345380 RepID=UPI00364122F1